MPWTLVPRTFDRIVAKMMTCASGCSTTQATPKRVCDKRDLKSLTTEDAINPRYCHAALINATIEATWKRKFGRCLIPAPIPSRTSEGEPQQNRESSLTILSSPASRSLTDGRAPDDGVSL